MDFSRGVKGRICGETWQKVGSGALRDRPICDHHTLHTPLHHHTLHTSPHHTTTPPLQHTGQLVTTTPCIQPITTPHLHTPTRVHHGKDTIYQNTFFLIIPGIYFDRFLSF